MKLNERFPPLYECSVCGEEVKVTPLGEGIEPRKVWKCEHTTAIIWANRKVTLHGKGHINIATKTVRHIKLSLRQFLSAMTGRSV